MELKSLITHLEQNFDTTITYSLLDDFRIDTIMFYSDIHLSRQENTLYLVDSSVINCPSFQEHCPGLPLLICGPYERGTANFSNAAWLDTDLPVTTVYNLIQEKLYEILKANLKKEELFHILQGGYGLQTLLDTAKSFLGSPVTLCSTSYSILCQSPSDNCSVHFIEHNRKKFISMNAIHNMQNMKVTDNLLHSTQPFMMHFDDEPEKEFLFCGIKIHQVMIGYICVESGQHNFTETEHQFVADLSKIISVEMQKDNYFKERSGILQDYLLTDLIEKNITSEDFARHRMTTLGVVTGSYFQLLVFSFMNKERKYLSTHHYLEQLSDIFENAPCSCLDQNLVVLLSGSLSELKKTQKQHRLHQFLIHNQMAFAASCPYTALLQTNLYYHQACYMLNNCDCSNPGDCLSYDSHRIRHLFSMAADRQMLEIAIHPDLTVLKEFDLLNRTEYLHTVRTYLENGRNAQQAATALNIHKSTFFYRLDKIKELTSFSLDNSTLLLQYEISLQLLDYLAV